VGQAFQPVQPRIGEGWTACGTGFPACQPLQRRGMDRPVGQAFQPVQPATARDGRACGTGFPACQPPQQRGIGGLVGQAFQPVKPRNGERWTGLWDRLSSLSSPASARDGQACGTGFPACPAPHRRGMDGPVGQAFQPVQPRIGIDRLESLSHGPVEQTLQPVNLHSSEGWTGLRDRLSSLSSSTAVSARTFPGSAPRPRR